MADNLTTGTTLSSPPSGSVIGTRQVTYSGDSVHIAPVGLATFSGSDDAKVATDVPGGGGVEATALRVTVASDSTGKLAATQSGTWTVQPGNTANTTAWKVDGSAVTQPVSGTFFQATQPVSGTVTITPSGTQTVTGTVAATQSGAWSLAANQSVNIAQLAGTATDTNSGNKSAGTLRVVLATDQPALTNKLLVTPDSVALPANQSVNVAQINGVATTMGNGASGTGVQRVTLANDSTGILATVTTVSTLTGGAVAHDGADSGNPLKVGAKAITSLKTTTLVSSADRTDLQSDLDGAAITRPQFPLGDLISERVSNTDGSSTAFSNFGAVASTRNMITGATVFRTDAGTSVAFVDFRDGTAGSVLWTLPLPPNGGAILPAGALPYFRTTANTALAFDVSSALTTVYINVTGFQSKL